MMSPEENIFQLMTEKLSGIISPEDDAYLTKLINCDSALKEQWDTLLATKKDLETNLRTRNWQSPVAVAKKRNRRKRLYTAAAILIVGVFGGGLYFTMSDNQATDIAIMDRKSDVLKHSLKPIGIQLTLANGHTINLTNSPDTVQVGNTQLVNLQDNLQLADKSNLPTGKNILTVPPGLNYKIQLPDNTIVWLNSSTTIEFPFVFNKNTREITISGEAYFEVAKDARKPFFVHTAQSTVKVLGTSFNLNSYTDQVRLSLIEGTVKLAAGNQEVNVPPGQEAIYKQNRPILLQAFDPEEVTAWKQGLFYFTNATLEDICKVLPRLYGKTVLLDNKNAATEKFTGVLDKKAPLKDFLESVKASTSVDYYIDDLGVIHFR